MVFLGGTVSSYNQQLLKCAILPELQRDHYRSDSPCKAESTNHISIVLVHMYTDIDES